MDDLRAQGFSMNDKRLGMTAEQVKLCLKAEAELNAVTFHLKRSQNLEKFLIDNKTLLLDPLPDMVDKTMGAIFNNGIYFANAIIKPELAERVEKYLKKNDGSLVKRLREIAGDSILNCPVSTLIHSDCWNNNFMFKYEEQTGDSGKTVTPALEVKLIDLQLLRYLI
jgi:hypothetical protein